MRLLFLLAILLAFPVMELLLLIELAGRYGWWLLLYLIAVAVLGWRLILDEKLLVLGRMADTLRQGKRPSQALFGSAKSMIAGVLLIIPGVLSDVLAVILLLMPTPRSTAASQAKAANDDVIEGEFRREDE